MDGCPNPYCEADGWVTCEGGVAKGRFRVPCRHPEHPHMTREEYKMLTFGLRWGYPQDARAKLAWKILAAWPKGEVR